MLQYAASAKAFMPLQLGLSCFTWTGSHYEARTFNIYLFPQRFDNYTPHFLSSVSPNPLPPLPQVAEQW